LDGLLSLPPWLALRSLSSGARSRDPVARKGGPRKATAFSNRLKCLYLRSSLPAAGTLTFKIESVSFPDCEGAEQKRTFELSGDELSYRVPARPDGNIPISVWHRLK